MSQKPVKEAAITPEQDAASQLPDNLARLATQSQHFMVKWLEMLPVDSGRIPDYVLTDEKLVAQLPAFFRTLSGQKPSREDLEKLVDLIKSANRP